MAIDDPVAQFLKHVPDERNDTLQDALGIGTSAISGLAGVAASVLLAIRGALKSRSRAADYRTLAELLAQDVRLHGLQIEHLNSLLESDFAKETIVRAVEEMNRTFDAKRVHRLAAVIGGTIAMADTDRWQETLEFVQDLPRLADGDLLALEVLEQTQGRFARADGSMPLDHDRYNEETKIVLATANARGVPQEEFYARCYRLAGFGLALPTPRSAHANPPGTLTFQMTSRGVRLLALLGTEL